MHLNGKLFEKLIFNSPEPLVHGDDDSILIIGCVSCVVHHQQLLQRTPPPKLLARFLTKLGSNDPYMSLFKNCSNGFGPMHI